MLHPACNPAGNAGRSGVRGSPFLQAMVIVAVFLLAGVPVFRLTRPAAAAVPVAGTVSSTDKSADAKPVPLDVEATFAPAPTDFQLKYLDQAVCEGHGPQARFSARWTAAIPPEGADLVIQARWPAAASGASPAAARVTVRFPDGRQVEKSFWAAADGSLADVFAVPGTP